MAEELKFPLHDVGRQVTWSDPSIKLSKYFIPDTFISIFVPPGNYTLSEKWYHDERQAHDNESEGGCQLRQKTSENFEGKFFIIPCGMEVNNDQLASCILQLWLELRIVS